MKLATFNVNSLKMRLPVVRDWVAAHHPDIFCLQEIKSLDIPVMEIQSMGYTVHADTQKAYNGVATLSRHPASITATRLPGFLNDEQARVMITEHNGIMVINIYAPNGNPVGTEKYDYKLKWLSALYDTIADLRRDRTDFIVTGDFNIIPEGIDAATPAAWTSDALFQREVRDMYRAILALGVTDCLRALHEANTPDLYSFWDYQAGAWPRNNGIRIDHILASPRLTDQLSAAGIDRSPRGGNSPSDHTPVWAEFDLSSEAGFSGKLSS